MIEVGKHYKATKPAEDWGIIDDEPVTFPEKVLNVVVLDKPSEVCVEGEGIQPLPDSLKANDWYFVRNVETLRSHWLNSKVYELEEKNIEI